MAGPMAGFAGIANGSTSPIRARAKMSGSKNSMTASGTAISDRSRAVDCRSDT
jgi:hypothetical protein